MTIMTIWFLLIIGAYLLGSVPASYLAGRWRGVDLRQAGTAQAGGGNLWRLTSWRLGLPAGLFDIAKGLVMVWAAQLLGLDVPQQIVVGLAAIVGHNWPVFLRFHGGRGIATLLGIVLILPAVNHTAPWPAAIAIGIVIVGFIILHSSPLPVFIGAASLPLTYWIFHEPPLAALGFLAIFLIIAVKRLAAQAPAEVTPAGKGRLLLNRLLFDRDISDRESWITRKSVANKNCGGPGVK